MHSASIEGEARAEAWQAVATGAALIPAAILLIHLFATPDLGLSALLAHTVQIGVPYAAGFSSAYLLALFVWRRVGTGRMPLWLSATACAAGLAVGLGALVAAERLGLGPAAVDHAETSWLLRLTPVGAVLMLAFLATERTRHLRAQLATTARMRLADPLAPQTMVELSGSTGITIVAARDIIIAAAQENYCEVTLRNGRSLLVRSTLSAFRDRLPAPPFARTHRSFIVNLNEVASIEAEGRAYRARLAGSDSSVPVSRSLVEDVADAWRIARTSGAQ